MTVQEVIDTLIQTTPYKIESHWHSNVEYPITDEVLATKVQMLLIRDNTLIISI